MATTTTATTMTTTARVSRAMRRLQRSSAAHRAAIANAAAIPIATNAKRSVPELVDFFGGGKIHCRRPSTSSLSSGTSTSDSEWDEGEEFEDDDEFDLVDEEEASVNKEDPSNAQEKSVAAAGHGWTGATATPTVATSIAVVAAPTAAYVAMSRIDERGSCSQLGQSRSQNTPPTAAPASDLQYHQEQKQRSRTQTRSTLECLAPSPTGTSAVASAVIEALWLFMNALVLVMVWLVTSFTTTTTTKANDSSIVAAPRTQLATSSSTESTGTTTTDTKWSAACYTGNSGASANRKIVSTVSTVNSDTVATSTAKCTDSAQDQASSCTNVYDSLSAAANSTVGCVASTSAAAVTTTITITDPVGRSQCKNSIGDDKQDHLHAACEAEVISQGQIGGDEQDKTNVAQEVEHPAEITSQGQDGDDKQDETSLAQGAEDGVKDQVHERSDDEVDQDQDQDQIPNQDLDQDEDQVKGYDEDEDEDEARAGVHQSAQAAAVFPSPVDHVQAEAAEDHAEEDIQIRIQADLRSESHLPEGESGDHAASTRASSEKSESESDTAVEPSDAVSTVTQQQRPSRKSVRAVYMEYPSTERYQRHLLSALGMRERVDNLTPANFQQQQVLRHQQQQWRW